MRALLAVDVGGTATRAVLVSPVGWCLGYGRAGGGNPLSNSLACAGEAVLGAASTALAGLDSLRDLSSIFVALAGSHPEIESELQATFSRAGVHCPITIGSDLTAMYCAGTPEPSGYAIVAGTGAAAVRVDNGVMQGFADGLGWLLGDAGSGHWIGRRVVAAVAAVLDGRGRETELTGLVLERLGITKTADRTADGRLCCLEELIQQLYRMRPAQIAQFAPLAFAVPEDPTAARIVAEGEEALVRTYQAVIRAEVRGPVVLGGGVAGRFPDLPAAIERVQRALGHPINVQRVVDGTAGAAVMALRHAGHLVDRGVFDRIHGSLPSLADHSAVPS